MNFNTIIVFLLVFVFENSASAQYKPVDNGSSIHFTIKNFGIDTGGYFTGLHGTATFDSNNLVDANFDISVNANTVNTNNETRDNHLRNETYFDVKNYPTIRFVSTKIEPSTKAGVLFIFGKLTIKSQTKDISFPFTITNTNGGFFFKGSFKINRKDFNIGGTSVISDNLEVQLSILMKK